MPDSLTIATTPALVNTADGFLVISRARRMYPSKPPYEYQHDADMFPTLGEAIDFWRDLEKGEIENWSPVAIVPCIKGLPIGSSPLTTFDMVQLRQECGA